MSDWTKVGDALPEKGSYVLVVDIVGCVECDDLIADVDLWDGKGWHSNNLNKAAFFAGIRQSIEPQTAWTHWLPFPELPGELFDLALEKKSRS